MVSAVYRGDEAKPSVQTCTCVHRTCNGYGVTGDRYGVGQSHPRCDPCYTLIIVETDASDYALGAILSIQTDSGEIHPVAFHSRTFSSPELNYNTHDKELLAIFDAFCVWRHFLEGSASPIDFVTDHKNLEYFTTTKVLSCRQARWSEYLFRFNLFIRFRPGRLGTKPDSLSRH